MAEQRVFVAFQGGGAKGIAHVGAYRALHELRIRRSEKVEEPIRIAGVAGTSAGAIIAALVSARYTPDAIFNTLRRTHLLTRLAGGRYRTPSELFTQDGWRRVALVGMLARVWPLAALTLLTLILGTGFALGRWGSTLPGWLTGQWLLGLWSLIALEAWPYLKGLAPLTDVRAMIDEALSASPLKKRGLPRKNIRFSDLRSAGARPLKIVATNITTKQVTVFSADTTPGVIVADAVCASICIPMLFEPHKVCIDGTDAYFIDGGPLSNLPLWTFDDDRAVNDNTWTIGFSLDAMTEEAAVAQAEMSMEEMLGALIEAKPPSGAVGKPAPFAWCAPAINAVIGGPSEIHARQIADLLVIRIPVWVRLLDFRLPFGRYREQIDQAHHRCSLMLASIASVTALTALLASLDQDLTKYMGSLAVASGVPQDRLRFRYAIFAPRQRSKTLLWVAASCHHDRFQAMRHSRAVRRQGSLPGLAFDQSIPGYFGVSPPDADHPRGTLHGDLGVAAGSEWTVAIPIFNPNGMRSDRPRAVLTIDAPRLTIAALCAMLGLGAGDLETAAQAIQDNVSKFLYKVPEFGRISERFLLWH